MTDEQIIRLSLETAGTQKAEEMARSFQAIAQAGDAATKEVYEFADAYEVLATESDRAMDKMVADAVEATRAQKLLADSFETTVTTTTTAGRGVQGYNFQLQAAAFAVQDFVSVNGDLSQRLMAVSNNIPGIVGGLGAWGAAIGGAVAVGAVFGPQLYEYARGMAEVANKVPPATDGVQRLKDALKANGDELDKLREKQSLSNAELLKFNSLTTESVKLEKELAEAVRQRKLDEELAGLRPKIEGERAAGFKAAVAEAGGGERVGEMLRQALLNIAQQTGQEFTLEGIAGQADQMMRDAASGDKGQRDAIRRAMRFLPNGGRFADLIRDQSPEARTQAEIDRAQQELDQAVAEGEARRAAQKEADARAAAGMEAAGANAAEAEAKAKAREKEKLDREAEIEARRRAGNLASAVAANTTIDDVAGQAARDMRVGGATEAQIAERLGPLIAREIFRASGGRVGADEARGAGRMIAEGAARDSSAALLQQGQMGIGNTRQLIRNQQEMAQAAAAMMDAQMNHRMLINDLGQAIRNLRQQAQDEAQRNAPRRPNQMRRRN